MAWEPELAAAFTAVSGGRSRLEDLHVSIAACLTAHALNVGYRPIAKKGVPALERSRLSHVFQNYFRPETLGLANAPLIAAPGRASRSPRRGAAAWSPRSTGCGSSSRCPAVFARPNRKYFGPKRGVTWLNMINDQAVGLGGKVVSGTVRDSLHMIDVHLQPGRRASCPRSSSPTPAPTATWSSACCSCWASTTGPRWPTCPTRRAGGSTRDADYGPLNTFARGRIDLARIRAALGRHPARRRLDLHRRGPRLRRGAGCCSATATPPRSARRSPPTAGSSRRCTSCAYIDADEPYRRDIKAHAQPAGRPPRPGPQDLPRQEGRAVPALPARAWRTSSARSAWS